MSRRSCGQPSARRRVSMRQATIFTAGASLHMLSLRQRQWLASVASGLSIWLLQVLQANRLLSTVSWVAGAGVYTARLSVAPHNSQLCLLSSSKAFKILMVLFYRSRKDSAFDHKTKNYPFFAAIQRKN